jgi:signal transduction histidine kinase
MMRTNMLFILLSFQLLVNAQKQGQALVDSLLGEVPKVKADTAAIKLYNRISDLYIDIDQEKAMQYADSALTKSKNINWKRGIGGSMLAIGNVYNFNGNPDKAIANLKEATVIFKEIGYTFGEASSFAALGRSYEALSNYPASVNYFTQALKIHESIPNNDLRIATSLSGIANIYYFQRDYKKSLEYSFKALEKKQLLKNKISIANENLAIGDTYFEMGDSANAEKFSLKALEQFKELGNIMGQANVHANLGKLYGKNYSKSLEYFYQAKIMFAELNDGSPSLLLMQGQVATVFLDMAKYGDTLSAAFKKKYGIPETKAGLLDAAEINLKKAIVASRENEDKENEYIFSGAVAEVQALKNDYKNAYLNLYTFHYLQDSLYSQENKNKIAAVEGEREVAIRDKEIELNKLALSAQRKQRFALIAGLCFLGIIGGLLYYQSQNRKKTNTTLMVLNNELDEANKIKTKFFSILSHDLRGPVSNLINFLHLQQHAPDLLDKETNDAHTKRITRSAENLLENMEELLLWSKGQMEHFKPNKKSLAVNLLFKDIENTFSDNDTIKFIFDNSQQLNIYTDEDYLKTIMRNLTGNSVKALNTVAGAIIEWKAWEENGKQYLSISDNGKGIDEQQLKILNEGGNNIGIKSGLGLHLVRDMAKAIACSISVTAAPGMGTSFKLAL